MKHLVEQLKQWFFDKAKPALAKIEKREVVESFEKQADSLDKQLEQQSELFQICVLGQARVGKSTLINTLVADTGIVVPSGGGDGPLTANALCISYGESKCFEVQYHGKKIINQIRFVLEAKQRKAKQESGEIDGQGDADDQTVLDEIADFIKGTDEDKKSATDESIKRAKILVTGSQNEIRTLEYLVDAMCYIQGIEARYNSDFSNDDMKRLQDVRQAVEIGSKRDPKGRSYARIFEDLPEKNFAEELRKHACGCLAPLIVDMKIQWPSEILKGGLEFIDLPGIGIHNDIYESITSKFLRDKAKAIMLVTDSGGLRKNDAVLLRDSGFLNRLLHSGDDPTSDPVSLIVAVVKIDDVASENWRNDKEQNGGKALWTKVQHFDKIAKSLRDAVKRQLHEYLSDVWSTTDSEMQTGKNAVIARLCEGVQVFPLSAPQYRLIVEFNNEPDADIDERPFLKTEDASQIPALRTEITKIAQCYYRERELRLSGAVNRFFGQLRTRLVIAKEQLNLSDKHDAEENRQKVEIELNEFLTPQKDEFNARRGSFRNYLRETIPLQIADKVTIAAQKAQYEIFGYLEEMSTYPWATIRAAVRRSGTFIGARDINLPRDFSLRFEEPVAQVWSSHILRGLRDQTKQFANYQAEAVSEVLDWARKNKIKVTTKLLEALVDDVNQQRARLNAVGKEAIEELREQIRSELIRKIEGPIRKRCEKFVADGKDIGSGVKIRMLEMIKTLSKEIVDVASLPAKNLLTTRFKDVEKEIVMAFNQHHNPLDDAASALLQKFEYAQDRDRKKEEEIQSLIQAAEDAVPVEFLQLASLNENN